MKRTAPEAGATLATLRHDAIFGPLVAAGGAFALVDAQGEVLEASPGGRRLVAAWLAAGGAPQLARLAGGLAPREGMRLERVRLALGSRILAVTLACRRIDDGGTLIVAATQPLPAALPGAVEAPASAPPQPASEPPKPVPDDADPATRLRALAGRRTTVRFLFETDAEGRFVRLSPELAEVVGAASADIVGRTWAEIASDIVSDNAGHVAAALAGRQTWSGATVLWRVAGSPLRVEVELAGLPVQGPDKSFAGFRGFGLCRLNEIHEDVAIAPPIGAAPADQLIPATGQPAPRATDDTGAPAATPADEAPPVETDRRPQAEAAEGGAVVPFPAVRTSVGATLGTPKVVPLRIAEGQSEGAAQERSVQPPPVAPRPGLSPSERNALREIARALGARFEGWSEPPPTPGPEAEAAAPETGTATPAVETPVGPPAPAAVAPEAPAAAAAPEEPQAAPAAIAPVQADAAAATEAAAPPAEAPVPTALSSFAQLVDKLPVGVLVSRGEEPLYANRTLLDLLDYPDVEALAAAGMSKIFASQPDRPGEEQRIALRSVTGEAIPVDARLTTIDWQGAAASLLTFRRALEPELQRHLDGLEEDLRNYEERTNELTSILDTATDGVIVLDGHGRILSVNRSAEALFGYDQNEIVGEPFTVLLAPESHAVALDYLEGLKAGGVASILNDGREVTGRVRQGGKCPLTMTIGRVSERPHRKFCVVLRDMTASKKAEADLMAAKRAAEEANAQKSDFLAKISHEIRTPLNAIIGFAEVMLEERFGPIGNERYKEYLKDIHVSGGHVISLVNDLLDLAKIEAGRLDLSFTSVKLNDVVASCVALMQPQANRERIVLRTSLAPHLPAVVADERSMRQIILNVLSNAVKFTDAGGQVIVSTAMTDRGEVVVRVRDTGIGMTDKEIEAALEPFRQLATSRRTGGTGLGLPLTKALIEANRGSLTIKSAKNEGTLVEITLPRTRVLAE